MSRAAAFVAYAAFALEAAVYIWFRDYLDIYLSPILFFGAGLVLSLATYRHLQARGARIAFTTSHRSLVRRSLPYAVAAIGTAVPGVLLGALISAVRLDPQASDIIPSLHVYVARFLAGDVVYAPIPDFGSALYPPYLTLQWIPFVIPELAGLDYRWLPFAVFAIGAVIYVRHLAALRRPPLEEAVKASIPYVLVTLLVLTRPFTFAHTVELLIVGFYYAAAASIFSASAVVRALGLTVTLLSRFAIAVWVPLYLSLIGSREGWRGALLVAALTALAVVALYVIPFVVPDPLVFFRGQEYYLTGTLIEWQRFASPGRTYHVHNGLAFAVYIYDALPGSIADRVNVTRVVHVVASLGAVALLAVWYRRSRPRIDHRLFALLSLKVSVATFYFFFQLPYDYYVMVSVFLSAWLVIHVAPRWDPGSAAPPPAAA
ncbi:MAG: hypothetical protein M3295_09735 [Chloroflexota bacterium]|nr:hypothetical protein [Chloroflexota bacterium]